MTRSGAMACATRRTCAVTSGPMPSPGRRRRSVMGKRFRWSYGARDASGLFQPRLGQRPLALVDVDGGGGLQGLADGVQALQHLLLTVGIDVEGEGPARGRGDGLVRQVDAD